MVRNIMALLSGVMVGGLIVGLIQTIANNMYPLAINLSVDETEHVLANMENGYYYFIIASHIIGSFGAGIIGAVIAKKHKISWGLAAAAIILIFTAYSNYNNSYPEWIKLIDISVTALAGYLGSIIPRRD